MKNLLTRNIGWKLMSLVIAAVIWFAIMNIADPVVSETFSGIPVNVVNDEVITSRGYQYTIETGEKVDITVKGKRSVVYTLNSGSFKAQADFNNMNSMYMANIIVECVTEQASEIIITQRTENMAIKLEDQVTSPFSVRVELGGKVREGYYCNGATLSSSLVQITGAASQVEAVKEVVAYVEIDDKTETFTADSELVAYNEKNEPIDSMKLSFSQNTIGVTVEIFRSVPVDIEVLTKGNPISGYYVENIEYAPSQIRIAADEETLGSLDKLTIEIDVTGYSSITDTQVSLSNLIYEKYGSGVYPLDDQAYAGIRINVVPFVEKTFEIRDQDISVRNVSNGLDFYISTTLGQTITIKGAENILNSITLQDLGLYVDMSGCSAGTHSRQLRTDYGTDIVLSSASIMVRLSVRNNE